MVFCITDESDISFRGIVTDIQDCPNIDVASRYPYDVIVDFIDGTGGKIPGWSLPWCGADDPVFVVVCPD